MVSSKSKNQVSEVKLSSVVPGKVSGDGKILELTNMDLVMKLHYLKAVYYFYKEASTGLGIYELKTPLFHLLDLYYKASGRVRRSENGRPVIKGNDSGVRIVEANCDSTLQEFLATEDHSFANSHFVYSSVVGPDIGFSPLVFIQFTRFKCGGLAVGLSWAHILGDAVSASTFIRIWAQMISAHSQLHLTTSPNIAGPDLNFDHLQFSRSLKKVEPVGDYWVTPNNFKMETDSLHISSKQLNNILYDFSSAAQPFEAISAIFWKTLAGIRGESESKIVTICTNGSPGRRSRNETVCCNSQVVSTVEANFVVADSEVSELAKLVSENRVVENGVIEGLAEGENEQLDFVVYGGNLTFVDLESADIYGMELKGYKAIFANFSISGVGDEGAVLVLPAPEKYKDDCGEGRIVTMVLPEHEIPSLKNHLKTEWSLY